MKTTKMILGVFSAMAMILLSACNDNNRKNDTDQMLNDSIQMAEENRLEQERMDFENNSLFAMVQEDTVLTTFSRNLESNDLSQTFLEDEGPYTVFAPSNVAYNNLSQEERDAFSDAGKMQENSARLYYLFVDEELTLEELRQEIEAADGSYTLTSMQGEEITATLENDQVVLSDASGNEATITESDVDASNGVVHVIDEVLEPSDVTVNEAGDLNKHGNNTTASDTTATNSGM